MLCKQITLIDGEPTCMLCGRTWKPHHPPPYHGNCKAGKSRGLGDVVAKSLNAIGVKKRKGCNCPKRQAVLNELVPRRWWDNTWAAVRAFFTRRRA